MSHPIEQGALARITHDSAPNWDGDAYQAGREFEVEDYVSADEAEDGVAFYWGSADGGMNNVTVAAEHVEQVKSSGQMAARRPPTVAQVLDFLGSELMGDGDGFRTDETDPDDNGLLHVYGRTNDGICFGVDIQIAAIYQTDF